MKKYSLSQHLSELKNRMLICFLLFLSFFVCCYILRDQIFYLIAQPLFAEQLISRKIIYTGLAEAFVSYIKLSAYFAIFLSLPVFCWHFYGFLSPGLFDQEKRLLKFLLILSPVLFYLGIYFVYSKVMPGAWQFFLSFEKHSVETNSKLIVLEARISEYVEISLQFMLAFGLSFQLPIFIAILKTINLVTVKSLRQLRRIVIVLIFIFAAILTPPDVLSQIALALPLMILYELSIIICWFMEKRRVQ